MPLSDNKPFRPAIPLIQTLGNQIPIFPENLKGMDPIPIRPTDMQPSYIPLLILQKRKAIILNIAIFPKKFWGKSFNFYYAVHKPARYINHVDSLVQQLSAAADGFFKTPFFFITRLAAKTITGPDKH